MLLLPQANYSSIMEALRFTAKSLNLELTKVPIPKVTNPTDVLIKVAYSGICGTDLHIIQVRKSKLSFRCLNLMLMFCSILIVVVCIIVQTCHSCKLFLNLLSLLLIGVWLPNVILFASLSVSVSLVWCSKVDYFIFIFCTLNYY